MIDTFIQSVTDLWTGSGFMNLDWRQLVMIGVSWPADLSGHCKTI